MARRKSEFIGHKAMSNAPRVHRPAMQRIFHRGRWPCVLVLLMALEPACRSGNDASVGGRPEPGVALALATERARSIHDVRYDLAFDIPEQPSQPIGGREIVRFSLDDRSRPVVLDFEPGRESLTSVSVRGKPIAVDVVNGHIVIGKDVLEKGENSLEIVFRAGDASLNRNPDFIYALFVPARAHLAFPCFDQPDLKARYTLELTAPSAWQAVANGPELKRQRIGDRIRIQYAETKPIPTYLFTFATGRFEVESAERSGRTFHMFHRETDRKKVERNRDGIFDLHAKAIAWLEDYTQIPYPFGKFDFVLIPSFQFGGMEHPGAIYYNASSIMLDESATENQRLGRASAIAHETAHMWFGDLVTMRWFNDVWMKEVFANFMAAKIVNPSFPDVNHELRFLVSNYPAAYGVDRTGGTHPIRQPLENLNAAGNMYGAIIYSKAPIVMRQLERMSGSRQIPGGDARLSEAIPVRQRDLAGSGEGARRPQRSGHRRLEQGVGRRRRASIDSHRVGWRRAARLQPVRFAAGPGAALDAADGRAGRHRCGHSIVAGWQWTGARADVKDFARIARPTFVLPTGGGIAYGDFTLDDASRAYLLRHLPELKDPVARGAAWVTLWEELLDRRVRPAGSGRARTSGPAGGRHRAECAADARLDRRRVLALHDRAGASRAGVEARAGVPCGLDARRPLPA